MCTDDNFQNQNPLNDLQCCIMHARPVVAILLFKGTLFKHVIRMPMTSKNLINDIQDHNSFVVKFLHFRNLKSLCVNTPLRGKETHTRLEEHESKVSK